MAYVDRRMALAREWDDLVARVRELDGFRDFLRPPPVTDLPSPASPDAAVVVNVGRARCDALLVRDGTVRSIPLPALTVAGVAERTARYLRAVGARAPDAAPDAAPDEGGTEDVLAETLAWLWEAVAEPVLDALGITGPPAGPSAGPPPRVWWCPTGLLTLLPLHAAGIHGEPGRSVIDRAVSSYTPTLRALGAAPAARPLAPARMLVVAMPHTPGQDVLPGAARERALLEEYFPGAHTPLEGAAATRAAVADALAGHRWAHFCTHGEQNLDRPAEGGLLLADGALTVADIAARAHGGEFAFLSACKTATGGTALPDEAVTLAAALQYTGYRHVVATLWSVPDGAALWVVDSVYEGLTGTGAFRPGDAAAALHAATRELRAASSPDLAGWVPFAHFGP
ncbi:CHAT domain-containing protein [Actinomadura sp. WMMB 499]|uniref:CHAT domain-containing protein n=1 Tax=Actinomadura sp. WMMB 499 TaxID=1219491 RepID=UPI0012490D94|nr:CHAT domain-containing protein [Actinomadura sp. WMMB 499]QFG24608.1 CHAT domain-containing protein [Actinomadura sp. WMMB 499]